RPREPGHRRRDRRVAGGLGVRGPGATVTAVTSAAPGARGWPYRSPARRPVTWQPGGLRRGLLPPRLGLLRPGPARRPLLELRPGPARAAAAGTAGRLRRALRGRRHHRASPAP